MNPDRIELVAYNLDWPKMAADEMAHLKQLLPPEHLIDIQHVGSTAIPGMLAKPIIDIQIAVDSLTTVKQLAISVLEADGYQYWYDNPNQERMFFVKGMPPFGEKRTHHVHICEPTYREWPAKILFRDYLIAHSEKAKEYAALKIMLSKQHTEDREKYTEAKTQFIESVLKMAASQRSGAS
ncbi:MAG: GrpB family protein [Gammaproteobacteria bacterium]